MKNNSAPNPPTGHGPPPVSGVPKPTKKVKSGKKNKQNKPATETTSATSTSTTAPPPFSYVTVGGKTKNSQEKVIIYFMIDISGSMDGNRINCVNGFLSKLKHLMKFNITFEVNFNCFNLDIVRHPGVTLESLPTLKADGRTDLVLSLETFFADLHSYQQQHQDLIFFYLSDADDTFAESEKLRNSYNHYKSFLSKNQDLFTLVYMLHINESDEGKNDLLKYFDIHANIKTSQDLESAIATVLNCFVEVIAEIKNTQEVKAITKDLHETKAESSKIMEQEIPAAVKEIEKNDAEIAEKLKELGGLYDELNFIHKQIFGDSLEKMVKSGNKEELHKYINHFINTAEEIKQKISANEKEVNRLIEEKGKNLHVLDQLLEKLRKCSLKLQKRIDGLEGYVVNIDKLGPNIRRLIEELLPKLAPNANFVENQKIKNDTNGRIKVYKDAVKGTVEKERAECKVYMANVEKFIEQNKSVVAAFRGKDEVKGQYEKVRSLMIEVINKLNLLKTYYEKIEKVEYDF